MITKEQANEMHKALDEILECSDTLYNLLREPGKLGAETRGFTPSHTLNNAVSRIRTKLQFAGFKTPK